MKVSGYLLLASLVLTACNDDDSGAAESGIGGENRFAVGSLVTGSDGTSTGYLKLVPSLDLDGDELDLATAREFPGQSDIWVWGEHVFVASGDEPSITKYVLGENGALEADGVVSFSSYGIMSAAFWNATFVSETRAYMTNGARALVAWNPSSMEIEGEVEVDGLDDRDGLMPRAALSDRSNVVHDGKVYRPIYWTNEDYSGRGEESVILVVDGASDEVVDRITVPCTGMDYGTVDDDGMLYFSTWTGSVGTRLVLNTPATCFVKIDPSDNSIVSTTNFSDITGGHEAAALKYVGAGKFLLSVFDESRVDITDATDPFEPLAGRNFQVWSYDPDDAQAKPVTDIDWNSGAIYHLLLDGKVYSQVPGEDYATTTTYVFDPETDSATPAYSVNGWSLRSFSLQN